MRGVPWLLLNILHFVPFMFVCQYGSHKADMCVQPLYKRAMERKNLIESNSFAHNGPVIVAITKFLIVTMLYLRSRPVVLLQNYYSKPFGDCERIHSFS